MDNVSGQGSWWVWACWLKFENDSEFIYGCASATSAAPKWKGETQSISFPDKCYMVVQQCTISTLEFAKFENNLRDGDVDLTSVFGHETTRFSIETMTTSIQSVLGHTAATAESYISFPDASSRIRDNFSEILKILEKELNFPFLSSYVHHLGCFEIFHLHNWLDKQRPFSLQIVSPIEDENKSRYLEIRREHNFSQNNHLVHVVGYSNDNVIFDRIQKLNSGDLGCRILQFFQPLDSIEFRLFDSSVDCLMHHEKLNFLREIRIGMSIIGKQTKIEDKLGVRASQKNSDLGGRAANVIGHTTQRSQVSFPEVDAVRNHKQMMHLWRDREVAPSSEDLWLAPNVESEVIAVEHLNKLINSAAVHTAVLVDPWFGEAALKRFATRLTSQDLNLLIVTSLADIDPDSDDKLTPDEAVHKLHNALNLISAFINPALSLINLRNGKDQAFHDRYLLLRFHEGTDKVYLLSNSLNKSAGDWPFCMSLLSRDVTLQVVPYIEGLCLGIDITGKTYPSVTFRWPNV